MKKRGNKLSFILASDTSGDIRKNDMKARRIEYKSLIYTIDGVVHLDDFSFDEQYKAFYDEIREGKLPTTSQINESEHEEFFEELIQKYTDDIVYIALSSGLSGSYDSAKRAAETIRAKTGRKIYVVDSLGATVSQQIVVDEAERLRDAGVSASEAVKELNEFIKRIHTWFMPTDLIHLMRGGRVSGAMAYIGTALNIVPIIFIDKVGALPVIKKLRGANKGLAFMAEMFEKYSAKQPHKTYVASADSAYADEFLQRVGAVRPDCECVKNWIGPVIGAHTGAGAVGVAFLSDEPRPY